MLRRSPTSLISRFNLRTVEVLNGIILPLCSLLSSAAVLAAPAKSIKQPSPLEEQQIARNSQSPEISELKLGQRIKREIAKGQVHYYRLTLTAGQFLHLTVEQKEIDVGIELFNPTGQAIAGINWEDKGSTESLWALAEVTGDYQLKIAATDAGGSDPWYIIKLGKVDELQTASPSEQTYVKAHRLVWEAGELHAQGTEQALQQAAEKYQEALPLWRSLNDIIGEAHTLHEFGYVCGRLGESQKALALYEQALPLWRAAQNHQREEANTIYNLGSMHSASGKAIEAIACFKQAIELRRLIGDPGSQAHALNNLGQVYNNLGEFQAALESHQEALRLRRAIGDIEGEARSLSNISGVYFSLGEFQEALNYCQQALPLRRAAGDRRGEAITFSNIGSNYRELGEPQKALDYSQRALSLLRAVGDQYGEAALLDVIGRDYYELGDYPKALEHHHQSLSLRQITKDRYGEGSVLANLGSVYARLGERQKALEYFEQSLQLRRANGDRRGEALTLQNAGELYRELGDLPKALAYFNQGLALSRAVKNRFFEANLLYAIARIEQSTGRRAEARAQIEAAITIIESTRAKVASADLRASFLASKQDFYECEIELLMQSSEHEQGQESLVKAFSVSEQRRARSLLDSLEEARTNIRQGASPELLARERALQAKLNQRAESQIKLLSGKHTPEQAAALAQELDTLTTDYEQVLAEIRSSNPHYAALTQPAPLSFKELQTGLLDPNTLLLEYALGRERSYLWAVSSTDITGYELPARSALERQARQVYDLLTARNQFVKFEAPDERQARIAKAEAEFYRAAGSLSQMLLAPVATKLKGKHLLIVSDGALQYLPFAALPAPAVNQAKSKGQRLSGAYHPLMVEHEVISLPSASVLGVLRRELAVRHPAPKTVAVLADPVFNKTDERVNSADSITRGDQARQTGEGLEDELVSAARGSRPEGGSGIIRLPFTRQEADAILGLLPPTDQFKALDFDASRAAATNPALSQYRIVHFATHGLLNSTHPGLSGLILSLVDRQGHDLPGFLPAHEIFNLKLPAELVVLSGCQTGVGKEVKGEGLLSLTRGFMYAGAARVVVSLWEINDESTAELMKRFYQGMLRAPHLTPAAALRAAQLAVWQTKRWHSPYYWAAFTLQGEPR